MLKKIIGYSLLVLFTQNLSSMQEKDKDELVVKKKKQGKKKEPLLATAIKVATLPTFFVAGVVIYFQKDAQNHNLFRSKQDPLLPKKFISLNKNDQLLFKKPTVTNKETTGRTGPLKKTAKKKQIQQCALRKN